MHLLIAALCLLVALPAWAEKAALVIGNGGYRHADALRNAPNDAEDVSSKLRALGFRVTTGIDLTREQTLRMVNDFAWSLGRDDTALFYFAGHAMQLGSDNYLLPVDAVPGTREALTESAVKMQTILASLENAAGTRLIILDACRNNPFVAAGSTRGGESRGLMQMSASVGSFIAFATQPGAVAADGAGRNSPFTSAFLRHVGTPGVDLHAIMRSVRNDVVSVSNGNQVPWENHALLDKVYLTAAAPPADRVPSRRSLVRRATPGEVCAFVSPPGASRSGQYKACASSVLSSQGTNTYGPFNLADGNPSTAWVEGVRGQGEGQVLAFEFDRPRTVSGLQVLNGYTKSSRTFARNSRVRDLKLRGSNGVERIVRLDDYDDWQDHYLNGFEDVDWIEAEILSVFPGTHYEDTAISELLLQ